MRISRRELVLLMVTIAAGLFGGSAFLARPKYDEWQQVRRDQATVRSAIELDKRLLASRDRWSSEFEELKQFLPRHSIDKKVDVYWLREMDNVATEHGVKILKRQVRDEERIGDVYELPIECREWEADLESLVHFLFDLQAEGAMLDIRSLWIKPKKGTAFLRGTFSLWCAYTRGDEPASPKPFPSIP